MSLFIDLIKLHYYFDLKWESFIYMYILILLDKYISVVLKLIIVSLL